MLLTSAYLLTISQKLDNVQSKKKCWCVKEYFYPCLDNIWISVSLHPCVYLFDWLLINNQISVFLPYFTIVTLLSSIIVYMLLESLTLGFTDFRYVLIQRYSKKEQKYPCSLKGSLWWYKDTFNKEKAVLIPLDGMTGFLKAHWKVRTTLPTF